MTILDSARKRYAAKAFNPDKPLSTIQIEQLKEVIRLSPSSINIQAWHFMIASNEQAKAKIATACPDAFAYNAKKIKEAPLVIVFCAPNTINTETVSHVIEQENKDGRFPNEQAKNDRQALLTRYIRSLKENPTKIKEWINKQSYIALGSVLLAAADMGIDSVPIEGFDNQILDEVLELTGKGLHSTVIAAFGYHSDDDFNAKLPKSRLPREALFTVIE